ncbi:MAG: hypothetical protein NTZ97_03960 [Candidatus Moranbacteria bacterium]|nr:hypothetical protein [Candidatus Moranbacteria bacterium]
MKIAIIGSSKFAKQMVEYQKKLMDLGHRVDLHEHYVLQAKGEMRDMIERMNKEHAKVKIENDYIKYHHNEIVKSDAVLVLNFDKNGIDNYIGGNTLIEMGDAYVLDKKIFLLNSVPEMMYTDEIIAMQPVILNGDLSKIKL